MLDLRQDQDGVLFWIKAKPRSKKTELLDIREGILHVKVTAPPVEGAANQACRKLLSKALGVSTSRITIRKGETAHTKLIHCRDCSPEAIQKALQKLGIQ